MSQRITFWATNEDLLNLDRLKEKWPRWGYAQLITKALAIAADTVRGEAIQETEPLSEFQGTVEELFGPQEW